jgi:hypothetical protein
MWDYLQNSSLRSISSSIVWLYVWNGSPVRIHIATRNRKDSVHCMNTTRDRIRWVTIRVFWLSGQDRRVECWSSTTILPTNHKVKWYPYTLISDQCHRLKTQFKSLPTCSTDFPAFGSSSLGKRGTSILQGQGWDLVQHNHGRELQTRPCWIYGATLHALVKNFQHQPYCLYTPTRAHQYCLSTESPSSLPQLEP